MAIGTSTTHAVAGFSLDGADAKLRPSKKPVIEAAFPRESYRPSAVARLVIFSRTARHVSVQVFLPVRRHRAMKPRDEMYGTPVTEPKHLGTVRKAQAIAVRIPRCSEQRVLRQAHGLGESGRLCAVHPSTTPSWYESRRARPSDPRVAGVQLARRQRRRAGGHLVRRARRWKSVAPRPAFDQRGVHRTTSTTSSRSFGGSVANDKGVELPSPSRTWPARTDGSLPRAYDLLIFSGHHEYVTDRETDAGRRLPQSRGESDVPLGEQLLLADRASATTT